MIRRPPRSTLSSSSAASDVYKRQLLALLSACTGIGDASQTKACRALADQVPGISGVKEATFTDAVVNSLPRCSGVVVLDPGLSTAQRGQAVGSAYDLSLIHISEPTRLLSSSYAVFCL